MSVVALTLWVIVLGAGIGGFFFGIGAALGKLYMWLKGE
jgi:hypothetical protein